MSIEDAIQRNAEGPRRAQNDSSSVEQHSLADQIEVDRYLANKRAARSGLGVRIVQVLPPGGA